MAYKNITTRREESKEFPGVVFYLRKMTEGRRKELRRLINPVNARISEILREQDMIEAQPPEERDHLRFINLQDEFDGIFLEQSNPIWIRWGVKSIEGLESEDGQPLTVDDLDNWPSELYREILTAVKAEAELNGAERKNFESPTISGKPGGGSQSLSIVQVAENAAGGVDETVESTIVIE